MQNRVVGTDVDIAPAGAAQGSEIGGDTGVFAELRESGARMDLVIHEPTEKITFLSRR
jgi:hypothetical protein